jgi:hypothetical protein
VATREQIADILARTYDGQPLADLRDEHAAPHLEAADAVLAEADIPAADASRSTQPVIEHALTVYFDGNADLARTLIDRLLSENRSQ